MSCWQWWHYVICMCCRCAVQTDGAALRAARSGLIRATLHMVNREFGELAADFVALGLLPPGADRAAIVPALTGGAPARPSPRAQLAAQPVTQGPDVP